MPQAIPVVVKAATVAAKAGAAAAKAGAAGIAHGATAAAHGIGAAGQAVGGAAKAAGSTIASQVGQVLGGAQTALTGGAGPAKQVAVKIPGMGTVTGVTSPAGPATAAGKMLLPTKTATTSALGGVGGVGSKVGMLAGKAMEAQPKLAALEGLVMGGKGSENVAPATVNQRQPLPQVPEPYQGSEGGRGDLAAVIAQLLGGQR